MLKRVSWSRWLCRRQLQFQPRWWTGSSSNPAGGREVGTAGEPQLERVAVRDGIA